MNRPATDPDHRAALAATVAAAAMIAQQVGGKATRDALFLSTFDVARLPMAVLVSAVLSILLALAATRALSSLGPRRIVPFAFLLSGVLSMVEGIAAPRYPAAVAALVYLHVTVLNSVLVSWFWSTVTERFDPRAARKRMGRIAAGAALGGLLGGIGAERVGAELSVAAMLPVMGALHILAGIAVFLVTLGLRPEAGRSEGSPLLGFQTLGRHPYLRRLASVVVLGTLAAACVDFAFKSEAVASYGNDEHLMRFFAIFYTGMSLLTFLVQTSLSRVFLEKLGLARTVGSLPASVALSSAASLAVPGLPGITIARGLEGTLRSSLFRSGYELLYTPIEPSAKRATKTLIDVGFDRLGDALGAALIQVCLLFGPAASRPLILGAAVAIAVIGMWGARTLQRGYVKELETRLLNRSDEMGTVAVGAVTESGLWQTMAGLDLSAFIKTGSEGRAVGAEAKSETGGESAEIPAQVVADPLLRTVLALRSGDVATVKDALKTRRGLDPALVPHAIRLLAWDEVSEDAARALARSVARITGQLADTLLDPDEEFSIRRRIPRILATEPSERAVRALFAGLGDRRFEVRFQCGRGLARLQEKGLRLVLRPDEVYAAVQAEVTVDRRVWEGQRLLDQGDDGESVFVDEVLRERASRSLEHVFTLLSLVLPREPLKVAFRGLHTEDRGLRGTALEYLESILPQSVRENLWPMLEEAGRPSRTPTERPREEILDQLLQSSESIQVNLKELREKLRGEGTP